MSQGVEPDSIRIVDEQIEPIENLHMAKLLAGMEAPRIVGITVLTLNCGRAYELARLAKTVDPECTVVFGGIHPTVATEEVLSHEAVDVVVRGEGEETLAELVNLLSDRSDYRHILGIAFRKDGRVVKNGNRPFITDLDRIPPLPYHLFEKHLHKYSNFSCVIGSRGCPHRCIFCSSRSMSGTRYRHHSVERVISEIKVLAEKYGQTNVHILDDNIAVSKGYFIQLCNEIIKQGLNRKVTFEGSMRGDNATEEVLAKAKEANFRIIYYGLETGSERLMKVIDKGETVKEVADAIVRADRAGLLVGTTIIFGLPGETRRDRIDTMKLVKSLPLSSVRFNTLAPYPGTPVYEKLKNENRILIKENWENFGVQYMWESDDIPYVPDGNDRVELIYDTMSANLSSYLSLSGIRKLLKSPVAGGNVIKLKKGWYFSLKELWKMFAVFQYIMLRFSNVAVRRCVKRLLHE
jgi:radical SAM superfamily enzyme YgiQ (UPF0313 family)